MITIKNKNYLSPPEVAEKIGRSKHYVYHNYAKWGWNKHWYGNNVLFEESQVEVWMEQQLTPDSKISYNPKTGKKKKKEVSSC